MLRNQHPVHKTYTWAGRSCHYNHETRVTP